MAAPVVEGAGLSRRFAAVTALADLDLEVHAGESLTIFGPNGAGKTTLIKILSAILRPTRGTLRLFGAPAGRPLQSRRVGLVSHGSSLYGDLTALENLAFYGRLFGVESPEARIAELLAEVELSAWKDRRVRTFSRGMEQRLALARAFLHDPDLLLLDEPYTGLDPRAAEQLQQILSRFHRRRRTIVLTTHDIGRGLEVCDRAAILAAGRLVWHSGRFVPGPQEMAKIYDREVAAASARSGH